MTRSPAWKCPVWKFPVTSSVLAPFAAALLLGAAPGSCGSAVRPDATTPVVDEASARRAPPPERAEAAFGQMPSCDAIAAVAPRGGLATAEQPLHRAGPDTAPWFAAAFTPPQSRSERARRVLAENGYRNVDVLPVGEDRAVVELGNAAEAMRLYALDLAEGELTPMTGADFHPLWTPKEINDHQVVFNGRDGHVYLADLRARTLQCATVQSPAGLLWNAFLAASSDGVQVAYTRQAPGAASAERAPSAGRMELRIADLRTRRDLLIATVEHSNTIVFAAVPHTHHFVALVRFEGADNRAALFLLDAERGAIRLTPDIPRMGNMAVSPDGRTVAFERRAPVRSIPPKPEVHRPPPDDREPTCDPMPPRGCGWVSDGCYDYTWIPCPDEAPLPPDPDAGMYTLALPLD